MMSETQQTMLTDRDQIDRIVREVLSRLSMPAVAVRETNGHLPVPAQRITFTETVITGDLLSEHNIANQPVNIVEKAILTPSAHDWIRSRNVTIHRVAKTQTTTNHPAKCNATVIVVNSTTALEQLLANAGITSQPFDCPDDAAELVAEAVTSGRALKAVVLAVWSHRVAMLANRHAKIRAAVIGDISDVRRIDKQMKPNVWCLDPTDRGFMELRNLHRQIAAT